MRAKVPVYGQGCGAMTEVQGKEFSAEMVRAAARIIAQLAELVPARMNRGTLFTLLSQEIKKKYLYDRLSIYLYDADREFLNSFTNADGEAVDIFSNTRIAHNTLAWQAITTREPLIVTDLPSIAHGGGASRLVKAGLTSSIVLPLILNGEVMGTFHLSFAKTPDNLSEILGFLQELTPHLTIYLSVVLYHEREVRQKAVQIAKDSAGGVSPSGTQITDKLLETQDMSQVMSLAQSVAKLHIPVLILGETGTGKSMLARWLHRKSARRNENFIKVNCPSLAPTLFESEMFGFSKGAFTGAFAKRVGRIELAQHGTLFLDEIGELGPEIQSKLLQVLEENSFERVGSARTIDVDIRVLSATNIEVERAIAEGFLRKDLYYRLATVVLHLPPLRKRKRDIPLLVDYFINQFSTAWELRAPRMSKSILRLFCEYDWPGNIRELRNVVSRLLLCSLDNVINEGLVEDLLHLPLAELAAGNKASATGGGHPGPRGQTGAIEERMEEQALSTLEENEKQHILKALKLTGGRIAGARGAACLLGIPRSTLQHRMRKLGIQA